MTVIILCLDLHSVSSLRIFQGLTAHHTLVKRLELYTV